MGEYSIRLANVLAKSRGQALFDLGMGALFLVVNLVLLRSRGTYIYVFSAIFALQTLYALRRRFKLRDRSPIVIALRDPSTLSRLHGWPYANGKYPPNKVPQFVIATISDGDKVRLKVGEERELRGFVAALRQAAPELEIAVPNVPAPKLGATAPVGDEVVP